ncbi:beta-defensin 125 [Phocoena sinus]|uniref:beta-defensin 125 n=1 Tax=Phocoena sinus TaxID=42100 RepID=UPI0013C50EA8|nr:beta-defensin 125 [Phocoena sinus]
MNLLMLTFMICGLLNLVTKAGWFVERCWKNDVGYCRKRCLHLERYKLLCMNKLSCCIPLSSDNPYTQWPIHPTFSEDVTFGFGTHDGFPFSPVSGLDDEVTIKTTKTQETTVTGTTASERNSTWTLTTVPQSVEGTTFSHEPETADLYKHWD